jgi:EpsI family protein
MTKLFVALAFLALNFYTYHFLASEAVTPPRTSLEHFPKELENGWSCPAPETMDERAERELGVTDYLLCTFRNAESRELANVYVGYHVSQVREDGGGERETSIHPPAHCLPGSGWDIIRRETVPLDMPGLPQGDAQVKRLMIAKGKARELVYYWYQSRGRVISRDWKKILYVGWDRAIRHRTDGSLVRFSVPMSRGNGERAEATFQSLAPLILARLPAYVPE